MKKTLFFILRVALACIFIYSGLVKLLQPYQNFLVVIQRFEILDGFPALLLARSLPWLEFIAGVFLAIGLCPKEALIVLWLFNSMFIGAIISALARRLPVGDCGCFGKASSLPLPAILAIDFLLWGLFFFMYRHPELLEKRGLEEYLKK